MSAAPKSSHRVIERTSKHGRIKREFIAVPEENIEDFARRSKRRSKAKCAFRTAIARSTRPTLPITGRCPIGVVVPQIGGRRRSRRFACATAYDVPVTPRGGGTALAGQTCNTAIIIDFSKYMHRFSPLDPDKNLAIVEPGCVLDHLRDAAEKYDLTFGPDPSTHDHNTLGGMIGNDSCGVHSIMAGRTADNVHSLDILTFDGLRMTIGSTRRRSLQALSRRAAGGLKSIVPWQTSGKSTATISTEVYPDIPRRVSGYENLDQLAPEKGFQVARALTGTEATCVMVLRPPSIWCIALRNGCLPLSASPIFSRAADAVPELLTYGPIGLEAIDHLLTEYMKIKHFRVEELKVLPEGAPG